MASQSGGDTIASQEDLERFATLEPAERQLTEALKGVVAETALTGRNRYPFSLVKPVVELLLEQTLREYEQTQAAEGDGPARPVLGDESLPEALSHFRALLQGFTKAPWTIQRLCEILLNPSQQYKKLHKLALAIEKCLMVTGEVGITPHLPPPPLLSSLQPVNDNSRCHDPQPAPHAPDRARRASSPSGGMLDPDAEDSAAFTNALIDVRGPPPTALHAHSSGSNGPAAHALPANNGHPGFVHFHQQQQQQHHGTHWGAAHAPRHGGPESMDEDDRWPTGPPGGGLHNSFLGLHGHHAFAAAPPAMHPLHELPVGAGGGDLKHDADFASAAEAAAAAAAAAVAAEGMEIETPSGLSVADGHKQPTAQEAATGDAAAVAAGAAAAEAAEAAARAVVGVTGASGVLTGTPGGREGSPKPEEGALPGAHARQAEGAGADAADPQPQEGSPAAAKAGQGRGDEGAVDRVPATPPLGSGKLGHEAGAQQQPQQPQE